MNHLGHFLTCPELLPCMMNTEGDKRIVFVSSRAAGISGVWDPTIYKETVAMITFNFKIIQCEINQKPLTTVVITTDYDHVCTAEETN